MIISTAAKNTICKSPQDSFLIKAQKCRIKVLQFNKEQLQIMSHKYHDEMVSDFSLGKGRKQGYPL